MIPFHHLQLFLGSPLDHTRFTTHDAVPFFALQSIMHNVTADQVISGTLTLLVGKFGHQRQDRRHLELVLGDGDRFPHFLWGRDQQRVKQKQWNHFK